VSFSPLASEKYERFSSFTPAIVKVLGVFPPLATTAWRARTFIYNITVAVVFMCINIHRPLVVRLTDRSGALDVIASQVAVSKLLGGVEAAELFRINLAQNEWKVSPTAADV
jgi:hypothetical protein